MDPQDVESIWLLLKAERDDLERRVNSLGTRMNELKALHDQMTASPEPEIMPVSAAAQQTSGNLPWPENERYETEPGAKDETRADRRQPSAAAIVRQSSAGQP